MINRLSASQQTALEDLLSMPVTGQGGWQTRMRRFHAAFGTMPIEGVSNDQRLMAARAPQTTATVHRAPQSSLNLASLSGPLARIEALQAKIDETLSQREKELLDTLERLTGATAVVPSARKSGKTIKAENDGPDHEQAAPRKRRKSIKRSRAMKAMWAARKAAAIKGKSNRKK